MRSRTRWNADEKIWETTVQGREVLADPRLNRDTAFTNSERDALDLVGLLPPRVSTLEHQLLRAYKQFSAQPTDLAKNVFLEALHDRNDVLFYRFAMDHLAEVLPVIYTPTVGDVIERFSYEYRRPRGIFLTIDDPDGIERALAGARDEVDDIDLVVVTDAQSILGIGDWGVGGNRHLDREAGRIHPCGRD